MTHRVLFAAHPTVGHTNALVAIARRMRQQGDEVLFSLVGGARIPPRVPLPDVIKTGAGLPDSIEARGVPVARLRSPVGMMFHAALLPWARGYGELRRAMAAFTSGACSVAEEVSRVMRQFRPDVVVSDFAFFAAWLAAEREGTPLAVVYHAGLPFRAPGVPPFGSGLPHGAPRDARWIAAERELSRLEAHADARINEARVAFGLPPAAPGVLTRPYSPGANLLLTHPALEVSPGDLGPRTVFTGPCLDSREGDEDFPWERIDESAYRVFVSMGTVFNTRRSAFTTILRALDQPGIQVIVSAGASFEALSRAPSQPRALIFRRVPQLGLLPRVDLIISHGGNNTINETLVAGKPLIVIPFGGEQIQNARRVEALGAGLSIDFDDLDEASVRLTAYRIRQTPTFAARAREIASALRGVNGVGVAADVVRRLSRGEDLHSVR